MILDLSRPLVAAPMAGGPTTPALVTAAARAGGLGFLAAGYRTPDALAEQIATVRATGVPFGVNLFAPPVVPVDPDAYARYRSALRTEAQRYAVSLPEEPRQDDDHWHAKLDLLLADPVPVVSFTFGVPEPAVVAALRTAGTFTMQTVTSPDEAKLAGDVDALVVQAAAAGGHSGTFTPWVPVPPVPLVELVAAVRAVTGLPLLAAGGLATAREVAAVLGAGAEAAVLGTVLLLADEAGTSAPYRAALAREALAGELLAGEALAGELLAGEALAGELLAGEAAAPEGPAAGRGTVITRAFSGRPARALRNGFVDRYDALGPAGYPAVHYLTSPIRRAAAAAGDPERINLWAGTGYRQVRAEPLADTFTRLSAHSP